jgi:CRISPR-associated protein Cmr2
MTAHLLLVTLGPVQDFIAQARRTRDLWYGSHLLSELSRCAARALLEGEAQLVFPALPKGHPELDPCPTPLRNGTPPLNVANKLLAVVEPGLPPEKLARDVREAVASYWRDTIAADVKKKCAGLLADGIDAVWAEQIDTFIEFSASWAPLGEYRDARRRVEGAVAGRKTMRDFGPWTRERGPVPKSSLDGARETVLRPKDARQAALVHRYRIDGSEQLDAVGLVKRAGGEPEQFVPVVNVALASWVELAVRIAPAELGKLRSACQALGISPVSRDLPCARPFPFDASVLLPSRLRSVFKERELGGDPEAWGRQHVRPVIDRVSEPFPYVACLVADGDRMGRAISWLGSAVEHRSFSEALSRFAGTARTVVEQEHRGALIYAGGDDVLAFLPLPEALSCAERLRNHFTEAIASACPSIPADQRPTLSVGLGVGHVMESMGELLSLGREAERNAKRVRNALSVLVDKRSGGRHSWRAQWNEDPARHLQESIQLLRHQLPSRKVYEIANTLRRLPEPGASGDFHWARILALEVRRSLSRVEQEKLSPEAAGLTLDPSLDYGALHARVHAWVDRLLIARTVASAIPERRRSDEEVAA